MLEHARRRYSYSNFRGAVMSKQFTYGMVMGVIMGLVLIYVEFV